LKEILKDWGKELWIAEEAEYGGKILIIKENKSTSQHFHKNKKETIYCFKGVVDVILTDRIVTMREGDDITLVPNTIHTIV
jgi:quercetin dioxygenase-like cupin family protein